MDEIHKQKCNELRSVLQQLFKDAGYINSELLNCIDAYEREPLVLNRTDELTAENERLKRAVNKLNNEKFKKLDSQSSRLRDALRE